MKKSTLFKMVIIILLICIVSAWKDLKQGFLDGFYAESTKHSSVRGIPAIDNTSEIGARYSNLLFNF